MRAGQLGKARGYSPEIIDKMKRFEPVWLPDGYRILGQLHQWKKPKTIFIGFMGDIAFQDRINITKILDLTTAHPQHRFIVLTKDFPKIQPFINRYPNVWFGYSDDGTRDERQWAFCKGIQNIFVSLEPLIGDRINIHPYRTKWIIIGALTGRNGLPVLNSGIRIEWVYEILKFADWYQIPVFLKDNLLTLFPKLPERREFPW
jgi:protein gp37